ncbi:MAG: hypothetical protein ABJB85_10600 [Nitrososphaerota archaeon]
MDDNSVQALYNKQLGRLKMPAGSVRNFIFTFYNLDMLSEIAIEYYNKRFEDNTSAAFIHLVREIGEIAFAIERDKPGIAQTKITEAVALLYYISSKYDIDLDENILSLYSKKLASLTKTTTES